MFTLWLSDLELSEMKRSKTLIRILVALCLGAVVMGIGGWQVWQRWNAPVGGAEVVQLQIPQGTSSRHIGAQLAEAGVIRSEWAWQIWTRTWARDWVFQAGTYDLDPREDMVSLGAQIRDGETVTLAVTVPEGWRIDQMAEAFDQQGLFPEEIFIAATAADERVSWLPGDLPSLEGYLFPETYTLSVDLLGEQVPPEQRAQTVVDTMVDQFESQALPLYEANQASEDPSQLSLNEWVTLASIVEKEAVVPEERSLIAGVFAHRLRIGMPLGADPTVEYALGIQQTPDRRLTWAEVGTPHPYNTYVNPGLPPGPIASPGLASLQAALTPEPTDLLFFVARYDGTHVFTRTLEEHEAAQRQILRERGQLGS